MNNGGIRHFLRAACAFRRIGKRTEPGRDEVEGQPAIDASAEIGVGDRDGGVDDTPEDLSLPVWAGVVPLTTVTGDPQPDAAVDPAARAATVVATAGQRQRGAPAAVRVGAHHLPA